MPSTPRRGRPVRDALESTQIEVARLFSQFKALRKEFESNINHAYPQLTMEQQRELRHTILGVAEEYRLWHEIDNALLAVQRHDNPEEKLSTVIDSLVSIFKQIEDIYQLISYTEPHNTKELGDIFNADYFSYLKPEDITAIIDHEIHLLSANEQAVWLKNYAEFLWSQADKIYQGHALTNVKQVRDRLRQILLFIQHQRLGRIYGLSRPTKPGRPSVPQPVLMLRAEQQVYDAHQRYRELSKQRNVRAFSPEELWGQHQRYLNSQSAGRKQLSPLQKLVKQKLQLQLDITQIPLDDEVLPKHSGRGRKPKSNSEKRQGITQKLATISGEIDKIVEASTAPQKEQLAIEQLVIEEKFIEKQLKSLSTQSEISDIDMTHWQTKLHNVKQQLITLINKS